MPVSTGWKKLPKHVALLLPLLLFWALLFVKIPVSLSSYLRTYYLGSFLVVLLLYYLCYRLPEKYSLFAGLCLTMVLFAATLSYKWTSGYSDNMVIGGLLPYKDAKNYFQGANLILRGLPVINVDQSTERPLFPGFLSSLFLFTDQNLKIALALITQLAAVGLYLSARQIRYSFGAAAATLYITFLYFYIQPLIGYLLSESLGFILGCFAFPLLWRAASTLKWLDLILGLSTLLMGVSARAGAFFIFPLLVVWTGWIFRGNGRFSLKAATAALIALLAGTFLFNGLYARSLGIPPGLAFGNFSYALYGQVRGGTGWHSAIDDLGTRNSAVVYQAALQFFLKHPLSLLIGFAKSYRDFFLPGDLSIFPFRPSGWHGWFDLALWVVVMLLLLWGLVRITRSIAVSRSALMAAGFLGIFLSIPFLPPIDGGARFYAATMPFFFVLPAAAAGWLSKHYRDSVSKDGEQPEMFNLRLGSIGLMVCTLIIPIVIYAFDRKPVYTSPSCPSQQIPFVVEPHRGSYIDLVKDGTARCGFLPEVCLSDFERNNTQKSTDDYYQALGSLTKTEAANVRIIPASNLIDERFHYFFVPQIKLPDPASVHLMSGCAVEIKTQNQSIYRVESILPQNQ